MKYILLALVALSVLLGSVYGSDSAIQKRGIFSRNHRPRDVRRRQQQILPPVVLPGIMNDYDPARIYNRGKRMFTSEENSLENRFPYINKVLPDETFMAMSPAGDRNKRSLMEGEQMIYVPQTMVHRRKRDLRRLKRDLDLATGYGYPSYAHKKRNYNRGPAMYPDYVDATEESEPLLQGLSILEYLALLKQAADMPTPEEHEQYYNQHSSPSRFAPQPRLFPEELLKKEEVGRPWTNKHIPQGRIIWSPEKRSFADHLSMVPGFMQSSFREADRMVPRASHPNAKTLSMDNIYGKDSKNVKIRRVAM